MALHKPARHLACRPDESPSQVLESRVAAGCGNIGHLVFACCKHRLGFFQADTSDLLADMAPYKTAEGQAQTAPRHPGGGSSLSHADERVGIVIQNKPQCLGHSKMIHCKSIAAAACDDAPARHANRAAGRLPAVHQLIEQSGTLIGDLLEIQVHAGEWHRCKWADQFVVVTTHHGSLFWNQDSGDGAGVENFDSEIIIRAKNSERFSSRLQAAGNPFGAFVKGFCLTLRDRLPTVQNRHTMTARGKCGAKPLVSLPTGKVPANIGRGKNKLPEAPLQQMPGSQLTSGNIVGKNPRQIQRFGLPLQVDDRFVKLANKGGQFRLSIERTNKTIGEIQRRMVADMHRVAVENPPRIARVSGDAAVRGMVIPAHEHGHASRSGLGGFFHSAQIVFFTSVQ